ncbi:MULTISPECIES: hypothetical protein [unclassified Sulfitobacter]|uniref:hypothetical protein n=1 Tax=unclassified Sulfitobacter TaxID=196795 RepID=UPI0037471C77
MNRTDLTKIVSGLRLIDMFSNKMLETTFIEDVSDEIAEDQGENCDIIHSVILGIMRKLHENYPEIPEICDELNRKRDADSRAFNEQREEQLRLLRLSGDDTPEEDVPFGPFPPDKDAA